MALPDEMSDALSAIALLVDAPTAATPQQTLEATREALDTLRRELSNLRALHERALAAAHRYHEKYPYDFLIGENVFEELAKAAERGRANLGSLREVRLAAAYVLGALNVMSAACPDDDMLRTLREPLAEALGGNYAV